MIAFIEGVVRSSRAESVVVETGGIGFEIFTPDPLAVPRGKTGLWHIYESIREDGWTLYGFTDELEYDVFMALIPVKGIGPRTALNILRKAGGARILEALEKEDVKALKALPGIGPKTASQMLLDMKGGWCMFPGPMAASLSRQAVLPGWKPFPLWKTSVTVRRTSTVWRRNWRTAPKLLPS